MEAVLKDQKQMIQYLHKQAEDHAKTRKMLMEINEDLEKEINEKDTEIMKLKKELKSKLKDTESKSSDVDSLLEDIEELKKINKEKEDTLAKIVEENQNLKENLCHLEKETEALKEENTKNDVEEYETNLSDELGIVDPRAHNASPAFDPPNLKSHDENNHGDIFVKKIWKLKELQLERSINSQKLKLTSDLLILKENELSRSENCACRTLCRITHKKHNWKKSTSQEIFLKFKILDRAYSCDWCDKTFQNVDCLKLHMTTFHVEEKMRGEKVNKSSKASRGRLL